MLGGRSDDSLIRGVLGVFTHGVDNIKLTVGEVQGHVGGSLVHGSGGDGFKSLSTDSEGGVDRCKSRTEVDRGLLLTGLASQGPIVTVHAVADHRSSQSVVSGVKHVDNMFSTIRCMVSVLFCSFGGGDKGSHS